MSTLMGAPHTTLTGTRWGPNHEKLGDVMPTCFRPHLDSAQQLCSDGSVDASYVLWRTRAAARQMRRLCGRMQAVAVRTDSHLEAAHQGVRSDYLRIKEVVLAKA